MWQISFHHIKNYGLAFLVAIQLCVVILAINHIDENLKEQENLSLRLTQHIESIHFADLAIGQAYHLFILDISGSYVLTSHVAEPLKHGLTLLDRNIRMAGNPTIKSVFKSVRQHSVQVESALILYLEAEELASSDMELYAEAIQHHIDLIHQEFLDLNIVAEMGGLNMAPYRLQILQQLFQIVDELFTQLVNQPRHQTGVIMQLLSDAETALEKNIFQPEVHRVLPAHEMQLMRENIQKIKINLPGIYENWKFDPNMSYIGDEVRGIRDAWDNLYMTLSLLSVEETRYLKSERQRLGKAVESRKQLLMILFGASVILAVVLAWLIRKGLEKRLNQLVSGIEHYVENREFRLPVTGSDMLCQIGGSFNQMADDLEYKEIELQKTIEYLTSSQMELHEIRARMDERIDSMDLELSNVQGRLSVYEYLFEYSLDPMLIVNSSGTIIQVNEPFLNLTGFTESDLIGKRPMLFSPESDDLRYEWGNMGDFGHISGEVSLVHRNEKVSLNLKLTWFEWNKESEFFSGAMVHFQQKKGDI